MRQWNERWRIFPFAFGCVSQSTVAADGTTNPTDAAPSPTSVQGEQHIEESIVIKKIKHPLSFRLPKAIFSKGIRRLIKSLKSVSHLIGDVYKNDINDDKEDEDEEDEMEIGYPTDVKHLTHIGWDGSTTISDAAKGWENLTPKEIVSFPSISLKQFEVAMAKQAAATATQKHV